jgi:hypothetical protein
MLTTPEVRLAVELTGLDVLPPFAALPQATTLPSLFCAAKAELVEAMLTTQEVRLAATLDVLPPLLALSQATTLPSPLSRRMREYRFDRQGSARCRSLRPLQVEVEK